MKRIINSIGVSKKVIITGLLLVMLLCIFSSMHAQETTPPPPQRRVGPVDASSLGTSLMMMNNQPKDSLEVFSYTEMYPNPVGKKIIIKKISLFATPDTTS